MSKPWRPDETTTPLRPGKARRDWARLNAYWNDEVRSRPLPEGGKAGLLLVAAACLAVAFGIYVAFAPHQPIAPGAEATSDSGRGR